MPLTRDVYIPVTNDCIHDCIFCSFPKVKGQHFPFEKIKKIIDFYKNYNYTDINFTGGEPTLHPELDKIIEYAISKNYNVRITSNGVKLADMNLLRKLYNAGLRRILFSVHHSDPEEARKINNISDQDLNLTLKGIENADLLDIDININITIIKQNYKDLLNIVKMLVPRFRNIHHFNFNFVDVTGNIFENLKHGLTPTDIVPRYSEAEKYLLDAFKYLNSLNISFRFERSPLCYASGFEHKNSNANRLAGTEFHVTIDFDRDAVVHDNLLFIGKSDICRVCTLNDFCNGIESNYVKLYGVDELYPVFINPNLVEYKIKEENLGYKEIVINKKIDLNKNEIDLEYSKVIEDIFNKYFGIFSHFRKDTKYLINIFDSPFRKDYFLKRKLLLSFLKILKDSEYDLKNFYILIPYNDTEGLELLKWINENNLNYIFLNNRYDFYYSFTRKNKQYYMITKEIDNFYGIINFLFPNTNSYLDSNYYTLLEFLLIFCSQNEIERYLSLNLEEKKVYLLDLFSILRSKIKNNFLILDDSILFSKDIVAFEYILEEKFQKYNDILDLIKENFLSYVSFDSIDIKEG